MISYIPHIIQGQHWLLTAQRAVFWQEEKALILSDLHLAKSGHFRKSGIAIPQSIFSEDMHRLLSLIQHFQPSYLLVVGDMFHSNNNKEKAFFDKWRNDFLHIPIHLVKGNHDILTEEEYTASKIIVHENNLTIRNIHFTHDLQCKPPEGYCVSGHVHPGVLLQGAGRQSLKFSCYYFGQHHAILPAFGKFTGNHLIQPSPGDAVFIINGNEVLAV